MNLIDSIKASTEIDLAPEDQNYEPIANLLSAPRTLASVLWLCIAKQAESDGVTKESFYDALDGDAYLGGWKALVGAIHFFIHRPNPTRGEAFEGLIEGLLKVKDAEARTQVELLKSQTTDEALKKAVSEIGRKLQGQLVRQLERSATNLPALSE